MRWTHTDSSFLWRKNERTEKLFTQVHGESGLGMGGAELLLPRISLWIVQGQLYLPFTHSLQF